MRAFALALLVLFATIGSATAVALVTEERNAIRAVVQAQLDAFQRDDGAAAFGYASPSIRAMFRSPEQFMKMVREGYAPVYRSRQVEFRDVVQWRGRITQRVRLIGPDGVPVIANYLLERQDDGSWRIDGCILEEVADLSV